MAAERISLCNCGLELSRIAWGQLHLRNNTRANDPGALAEHIELAISLGVTTIDHADIYGSYTSEALFGSALRHKPSLRDRCEIVTKCGIAIISKNRPDHLVQHYNTTREHIIRSAEQSLKHLHTDYLDLLLIHRPDPLLDPDIVAEAMTDLRLTGKVRHFGASNFSPAQFDLLQDRVPFRLVTNQVEASVLHHHCLVDGTLDHCRRHRMVPTLWSPLGEGELFTSADKNVARIRNALELVGDEVGAADIDQVALAWLLTLPSRPVVIVGTQNPDRLMRQVGAIGIHLSRQYWFTIYEAVLGEPIP